MNSTAPEPARRHPNANRLADRFGVGRVVLVSLDVSFYVFRRHQTNLVTELRQLSRPIMRRSTRLHANKAGPQRRKKLHHLTAAKLLPDDDRLGRINAISKPIVVICMWTAPYVVCSNDHLTAIRRRERAPSTTSQPEITALQHLHPLRFN